MTKVGKYFLCLATYLLSKHNQNLCVGRIGFTLSSAKIAKSLRRYLHPVQTSHIVPKNEQKNRENTIYELKNDLLVVRSNRDGAHASRNALKHTHTKFELCSFCGLMYRTNYQNGEKQPF